MDINERIFHLLDLKGLTAKDLGQYIGVKPSSISAWKNEGSYPSSKHIVRISEFLGVSIDFLFTGKEFFQQNSECTSSIFEIYSRLPENDKREVDDFITFKYNRTLHNPAAQSSTCQNGKKSTTDNSHTA